MKVYVDIVWKVYVDIVWKVYVDIVWKEECLTQCEDMRTLIHLQTFPTTTLKCNAIKTLY